MSSACTPRVTARRLSFGYGPRSQELHDVSVCWDGGVVGLLGPNGAGKTTLLRLLVGAQSGVSAGQLSTTPGGLSIGYVPQQAGWPGTFTVRELLEYAAWWNGVSRADAGAAVDGVLNDLGLREVSSTRLRRLSGGTHRRTMVAQALVHHPQLLVMDEPAAGLDIRQRADLRAVIERIAQLSMVVLSSHVVADIEPLATWICILDRGRVQFDGPTSTLPASEVQGRSKLEDSFLQITEP